jgi:dihydrofolate synthase / folylpolyglutamate synthase
MTGGLIMTYEEAINFLKDSEQYGSVLGLDSMRILLEGLNNPQNQLKFVHIAGTNGKGSTAAFISNIIAVAGYKVGRYISPYVFEYNEIIQISYGKDDFVSTEYITDKAIGRCIEKIEKVCKQMVQSGLPHPTRFEIETAMAMLYFLEALCDLVVLEVGLGGRLDATNVITSTLCAVITSISMDHMHILGDTLEKIAQEKAGIIKPNTCVVSYDQKPEAKEVIEIVSKLNNAELSFVHSDHIKIEEESLYGSIFSYEQFENLKIHLLGNHQINNAIVAILATQTLKEYGFSIEEEHVHLGLSITKWNGRFELIHKNPSFYIDGAHNEDAAKELSSNIKKYFPNKKIVYILGVLADKDYNSILKHTGELAKEIITITPNNSRGLQSKILSDVASRYCDTVTNADSVKEAVQIAFQKTQANDIIIAFGSLSYLKDVYDEVGKEE